MTLNTLTGSVVEAGTLAALGDSSAARVMARMAARPGPAIVEFQAVLDHRGIEGLREDRLFWSYVEYGNVDAALNRASFIGIARDAQLRSRLADLGLIEVEAATDDRAFRTAIAEVLREVGPRIRGLREDPELQRLLDDPEVVAMLQSGDSIGLVGHRGFRELVTRVAAGPGSTATR